MSEKQQIENEHRFCRKHVDTAIGEFIAMDPGVSAMREKAIELLTDWMDGEYYDSKMRRIQQLRELDLVEIVDSVLKEVAYIRKPALLAALIGKLAARFHMAERKDALTAIAEIVAVICYTDAYDIGKPSPQSSLMIVSKLPLPADIEEAMDWAMYLPPMVCEPVPVTANHHSGYLTFSDHLVLGRWNTHSEDICLDVINTQNRVVLQLDEELIENEKEVPNKDFERLDSQQAFEAMTHESGHVYQLMIEQGNKFWLTNKVDKRGRLYAQGYHISTQGTAYKKAIVELYNEELIEGD